MKLPSHIVPWIIAGVTVLFAGALAVGLYQGALLVPSKGFQLTLQRATNPVGFYVLAAFYSVLTGLSGYLLMAVLNSTRASPKCSPPPRLHAHDSRQRTNFAGRVQISEQGRSGQVIVSLDTGTHAFLWEFCGAQCVAFISVPTAEQWPTVSALAPHPRNAFLLALAREVGARQCPGASYTVTDDAIVFNR